MGKSQEVGAALVAVVARRGDGLRLTIRARATRRRVAVVEGSEQFVRRALTAVGLLAPTPIASLSKDRDRPGVPLVSRKPANGDL